MKNKKEIDFIKEKAEANDAHDRHGHWLDLPLIDTKPLENVPVVECSVCGVTFCDLINQHRYIYRFCPYCGARMDFGGEK